MPGRTSASTTPPKGLSDADYRADRGAFFKSVHGTLNHLLVADRIWMRRFTGRGRGAEPARCDPVRPLPNCAPRARGRTSASSAYVDGLSEATGRAHPLPHDLQTADRAAAGAGAHPFLQPPDPPPRAGARLLTGIAGEAPSLDLILFQRRADGASHEPVAAAPPLVVVVVPASARPEDVRASPFRVWPHDLDTSLHMNNGRYWTLMDLGRADLMIRSGLWPSILRNAGCRS